MRLGIFILISLVMICGAAVALQFNEKIEVEGGGNLFASTNTDAAKDQVDGTGSQNYTKVLKLEGSRSNLVSNYDLKNGSLNKSSYYYVEMKNPFGLSHSFRINANSEIKSESSIQQYEDRVSTIYDVRSSGNATLSETVTRTDPDCKKSPDKIIETNISGNFSIRSALSDSIPEPVGYTAECLLAKLNAVDLRGDNPVEEDRTMQAPIKVIRGREAPLSDSEDYLQDKMFELMGEAYNLDLAGDFTESLEIYKRILEIDPEYDVAFNNMGYVLFNLGRYYEAIESYDKALSINPNYADAWNNKGSVLMKLKRYDEALECYENAIGIDHQNVNFWNNKGTVLVKLGKYDEAIESFNRSISIEPEFAEASYNKGVALVQLGYYTEAIKLFNSTIKMDPEHADAWYYKGVANLEMNNYGDAIISFNKSISIFEYLGGQDSQRYGDAQSKLRSAQEALGIVVAATNNDTIVDQNGGGLTGQPKVFQGA